MAETRAEAALRRAVDLAERVEALDAYQAALGLSRLNRRHWSVVLLAQVEAAERHMTVSIADARKVDRSKP